MTIYVVNSFKDLKKKSSGGGGFSDGGVLNESLILKPTNGEVQLVEIAPPPGEAYGALRLASEEDPGGVNCVNFDLVNPVVINEYFIFEDGTESTNPGGTFVAQLNVAGVSKFFEAGGVLQYPNKLRYRLIPNKTPIPTGKLLLKYTLMRFDRPADQTF